MCPQGWWSPNALSFCLWVDRQELVHIISATEPEGAEDRCVPRGAGPSVHFSFMGDGLLLLPGLARTIRAMEGVVWRAAG